MTGIEALIMLGFTCACVYFNWQGGFKAGFLKGGSVFYDMAVEDTIKYLVKTDQISPHLKHHITPNLIEAIAQQAAKDRGYAEKTVENSG